MPPERPRERRRIAPVGEAGADQGLRHAGVGVELAGAGHVRRADLEHRGEHLVALQRLLYRRRRLGRVVGVVLGDHLDGMAGDAAFFRVELVEEHLHALADHAERGQRAGLGPDEGQLDRLTVGQCRRCLGWTGVRGHLERRRRRGRAGGGLGLGRRRGRRLGCGGVGGLRARCLGGCSSAVVAAARRGDESEGSGEWHSATQSPGSVHLDAPPCGWWWWFRDGRRRVPPATDPAAILGNGRLVALAGGNGPGSR